MFTSNLYEVTLFGFEVELDKIISLLKNQFPKCKISLEKQPYTVIICVRFKKRFYSRAKHFKIEYKKQYSFTENIEEKYEFKLQIEKLILFIKYIKAKDKSIQDLLYRN